jgi:hypothetical protein
MKGKVPRVGRNDPCPCGSGKKYKQCHEARAGSLTTWQRVGLGLVLAAVIGGLVLAVTRRGEPSTQLGVWSAEHGHYH